MTSNAGEQENILSSGMALVLEAIRLKGATSQVGVVEATGLGRAAAAERVGRLAAIGLIEREGRIVRGRGRPSRELRIRGSAGHLLAASLRASSAEVAISDLAGRKLAREVVDINIEDGPEPVLDRIDEAFADICKRAGSDRGPLLGIGVGLPGPVDFNLGCPVAPPIMPGWDGYPVAGRLRDRYEAPAWVDGDVNVLALGEWRQGAARGHDNVVYLKIGEGIGVGIIADGALRRGEQGAAGDIGHVQVTDDPSVVCWCGNVGCLEPLAGGFAIARQGERAAQEGRSEPLAKALARAGKLSVADVGRAAALGDLASTEILQRAGRYAGTMLAAVVNLLNPSLVVIGGGVALAGDVFLAAVRESVYRRSVPLATRHLVITLTELREGAATAGAVNLVLDELFSEAHLGETLARMESAMGRGQVA